MTLLYPLLLGWAVADEGEKNSEAAPSEALSTEEEPAAAEPTFLNKTLDNGMEVSIYSDASHPVVATQIWVSVGSAQETDSEKGFAHLFEHLMFGDTENHDKRDYNELHIVHGGSENAYTAFDNTVYISEIPADAHQQLLELEADRFQHLILDEDALNNEKKIVTEELRLRSENNPQSRLVISTLVALFGEHPYSKFPAGTREDINAADLELCKKFYHGYYTPQNLHLVIVGPVAAEETMAFAEDLFGALPNTEAALTPPTVPTFDDWSFPEEISLQDDIPPIKLAARIYPLPRADHDDYWSLQVLGQMLAGSETDLFREELVTKRGKAVEAFSGNISDLSAGGMLFFGSVSLPTRSKRRAFKLIDSSMNSLNEQAWMTEENLKAAKRALLMTELQQAWYPEAIADKIGWYGDRVGKPEQGLIGGSEQIAAVDLASVERVWNTYVSEATPTELFIKKGKAQELAQELTEEALLKEDEAKENHNQEVSK